MNSRLITTFRRSFKGDDSKFILSVGLKVSGVSLGITLFIYYILFLVMRLNYAFFQAHGFPDFLGSDSPFYEYIIRESLENLIVLFSFHVILFFIGTYVGWLILRPFKILGEYAESSLSNNNAVYQIDEFSNYRLLTRFSEFFFEFLREGRIKGKLSPGLIPPQFSKIHRPAFDKIFMLHFGLLLIIISIASAVFIIENTTSVFQGLVDLASKTLSGDKINTTYFNQQIFILDEIIYLTLLSIFVGYIVLGLHLYNKVSGAAFGIFSTMRSFMKGNYNSRVHLVGFAHVREHTRKLNKYLDFIQNNFTK